jgi:hypothetical protein
VVQRLREHPPARPDTPTRHTSDPPPSSTSALVKTEHPLVTPATTTRTWTHGSGKETTRDWPRNAHVFLLLLRTCAAGPACCPIPEKSEGLSR